MLDENLPAFFFKPATDGTKHHSDVLLSHHGSDPEPAYSFRHADPASPTAQNRYAAALFDSYSPDVLYGEVLAQPTWTQPSLSAEEIRRNGGVPLPPQPVLPTEFVIQLYNPDQQVTITQKPGSWGGSSSYEFSMPQATFRTPSASALDRSLSDPAAAATTPKINFVWRKESKLSRDLTCFLTGKSTDTAAKKKHREPDIAVALFRSLRELTVYEPNLSRVQMEDAKGLEVVLLLGAAVIKDIYFGNMREVFQIRDTGRRLSSGGRKPSNLSNAPPIANGATPPASASHAPRPPIVQQAPAMGGLYGSQHPLSTTRRSLPKLQTTLPNTSTPSIPPTDPRSQWEIDAETARLRAQAEAEERERRRAAEARRREREKAAEAETRRLRKMVEAEEREARRRQAEVDRETERLRKQYGVPQLPQRHSAPQVQMPYQRPTPSPQPPPNLRPQRSQFLQPIPQGRPSSAQQIGPNGLALRPAASSSALMSSGAGADEMRAKMKKKKSFWGLGSRDVGDENGGGGKKLSRKASSVF
ncbi:hypothetical protein LTR66_004985 [Elasticomyces elasticus]|nr:hypothetical protein LTR66_004985 [Elasticomyces elasticus]